MEEMISTKLGNLYAKPINDRNYPGIMIGLERNGVRYEFAWVEVDQYKENDKPIMKIHVFGVEDDDPIYDANFNERQLKELYEEDE